MLGAPRESNVIFCDGRGTHKDLIIHSGGISCTLTLSPRCFYLMGGIKQLSVRWF